MHGMQVGYSCSLPGSALHGQASLKTRRSLYLIQGNDDDHKNVAWQSISIKSRRVSRFPKHPRYLRLSIRGRKDGDITHFITLTYWKDMDSIKAFAGEDVDAAKYYSEDKDFLLEFEPKVIHYEVVGQS